MQQEDCIIVGGGPCGLAAAIALQDIGKNPLIIEKGNIVNSIYHYPTHQTFFSSSEKLEIGEVPFITENLKPKRNQALTYYREVTKRKNIRVNRYEMVMNVEKENNIFIVNTSKGQYCTPYVIVATGYYDHPNYMNIPGEDLDKVLHYFKEPHPFFDMDVTVIGGKNSAVDAAIELNKAGARVTVLYRGSEYSQSVKPWILPEFDSLIRNGAIRMEFKANVVEIKDKSLIYEVNGAKGKGVLVVLNDEIHTAKNVTKTHTSNVSTFQSPQYGPIGIVAKQGIIFHHQPTDREFYSINNISKKVALIKAHAGMDSSLLFAIKDMQYDGVVIEALGQGNLPPSTVEGVQSLIDENIPVVVVSRCFNGIVQDVYGYEGGGKRLKEMGAIFSNGLNGQKARIKLLITLSYTQNIKEIEEIFHH